MSGSQDRENGVRERFGQVRVVPNDDATLRAAESLACGTRQYCRALAQRILELAAGNQSRLMCSIEKDLASPFRDDLTHRLDRIRKERHGKSEGHQLRTDAPCNLGEQLKIDVQFRLVERNVHDLKPRNPAGPSVRLLECPPTG